ncbi:GerW family sporulation protein [Aneurinibacillus tyrosinisolvens]|uniref:GerW family sporulation protein n=1 Tax=Aneurinibacillus tyrosinisolvens TaxID=1443435 RepID=UPI00063F7CBD|nr:GerW family sporulation protein [Aneurinibacillus tyrosinisolvens]
MTEHPINGLMKTAMENIRDMVDVNTIIGDPVETPDGSIILPVSKVGFGFAAGGSEFEAGSEMGGQKSSGAEGGSGRQGMPFGGGSGGGISITPVAFLVVGKTGIRSISLQGQSHLYEKMMDLAPAVFDKIQSMIKQTGTNNENGTTNAASTGGFTDDTH